MTADATPGLLDPAVSTVRAAVPLRPQSAVLTFLGDYANGGTSLVAAGSLVDVLGRLGIGEHAVRATLARMVRRGLLRRELRGRRAFLGFTAETHNSVLTARARVKDESVVTADWDGSWTLVAFSMPEGLQRERHDLRSRLTWAGFGMAQSGLWVAPRTIDVTAALAGLDAEPYLRAFHAVPVAPTEAAKLVREAYDLGALAARHTSFGRRWAPFEDGSRALDAQAVDAQAVDGDPLARRMVLAIDWLQVVRDDPRLPRQFLPADWPAAAAATLFRRLDEALRPAAERIVRTEVEILEVESGTLGLRPEHPEEGP